MTLSGWCFKALFSIPLGPGAMPTSRPQMVSWTSVGFDSLNSLAGAKEYAHIASYPPQWLSLLTGCLPAKTEPPDCLQGLQLSQRPSPPSVTKGGEGVGNLITHLVISHNDWSSESRLHWLLLHSLSWLVTDLCRWLTPAFRAGSLEICHCLLNWVFRHVSSWIRTGIRGYRSSSGRHLGVDSGNCQDSAWQFLVTRVNCHLIWEVRVGWKPSFQAGLEFGSVSP